MSENTVKKNIPTAVSKNDLEDGEISVSADSDLDLEDNELSELAGMSLKPSSEAAKAASIASEASSPTPPPSPADTHMSEESSENETHPSSLSSTKKRKFDAAAASSSTSPEKKPSTRTPYAESQEKNASLSLMVLSLEGEGSHWASAPDQIRQSEETNQMSFLHNDDLAPDPDSDEESLFFRARQVPETTVRLIKMNSSVARSELATPAALEHVQTIQERIHILLKLREVIQLHDRTVTEYISGLAVQSVKLDGPHDQEDANWQSDKSLNDREIQKSGTLHDYYVATGDKLNSEVNFLEDTLTSALIQHHARQLRIPRWQSDIARNTTSAMPVPLHPTRATYSANPAHWSTATPISMASPAVHRTRELLEDAPPTVHMLAPHTTDRRWLQVMEEHSLSDFAPPAFVELDDEELKALTPMQITIFGWNPDSATHTEVRALIHAMRFYLQDDMVFPVQRPGKTTSVVLTVMPTTRVLDMLTARVVLVGHLLMGVRATTAVQGTDLGIHVAYVSLTKYASSVFTPADFPYGVQDYIKEKWGLSVLIHPRQLNPRWMHALCETGELELVFQDDEDINTYMTTAQLDVEHAPLLITSIPGQEQLDMTELHTTGLQTRAAEAEYAFDLIGMTLSTSGRSVEVVLTEEGHPPATARSRGPNKSGRSHNIRVTFDELDTAVAASKILASRKIHGLNGNRKMQVSVVHDPIPRGHCYGCYHPDNHDQSLSKNHSVKDCPRALSICKVCHGDDHRDFQCAYVREEKIIAPRGYTKSPVRQSRAEQGARSGQSQRSRRSHHSSASRGSNTHHQHHDSAVASESQETKPLTRRNLAEHEEFQQGVAHTPVKPAPSDTASVSAKRRSKGGRFGSGRRRHG